MFGMGMPEIMLILAVALVVIGPKKLPGLAKSIGRAMGEFKSATRDFKRSIDIEGDLQDVRESFDSLKDIPTYDPDKGAYERKAASESAGDKPDKTEQASHSTNSAEPATEADSKTTPAGPDKTGQKYDSVDSAKPDTDEKADNKADTGAKPNG